MTTRVAVVEEALTWEQTPYRHHARLKGVGVDCAQILCAVYESVGLSPHVELGNYAPDWHMHRSVEVYQSTLATYMTQLAEGVAPQIGDVALFRFGRAFSHAGILISEEEVLHAYIGRGVIRTRWRTEDPLAGRDVVYFTAWGA